jgi:hypothetical protein
MKTLFTLFAIICTVYAYNLSCPLYNCSDTAVAKDEECALECIGNLTLKKCNTNLTCQPINFGSPSVCIKSTIPDYSVLPGEVCTEEKQCTINKCKDSTCAGYGKNESCNSTSQCDKGLYCKDKKCIETGKKGDSCNDHNRCSVNLICNRIDYTCIEYGSIKVEQDAPFPAACETYNQDKDGKCAEAPKIKNLKKLECPESGKCEYLINEESITTPCTCAKTDTGKKYCPPGKGDIDVSSVILIVIRIANSLP